MRHWRLQAKTLAAVAAAGAALSAGVVLAQGVAPPAQLSGRWTHSSGASNLFSLEAITPKGADEFTARLTWWTTNSMCTVRDAPITGRLTAVGLTFDAATKCGDAFTAALNRGEAGWTGQATTKKGAITVDMVAE